MRQFLDDVSWLLVQSFKVVATLCCIGYGMTGWVTW
jgi:hypothetical protein